MPTQYSPRAQTQAKKSTNAPMQTKKPTIAMEPFNHEHADIVLRTSDDVHFLVHKQILMTWSPFWQGQFLAMEQEETQSRLQYDQMRRLIVPVSEDSRTLDSLLRHVYPVHNAPTLRGFQDTFALLEAARKYEIIAAVKASKKVIAELAEQYPLRVYALAAKKQWEHEMRTAAIAALGHPINEMYVEELESIPAGVYYRLLAYYRACVKAVADRMADLSWIEPLAAGQGWQPGMFRCRKETCGGAWFSGYLSVARQALRARPRAKTLENPELINAALSGAIVCEACRTTAFSDVHTFNALLAGEVGRVLEEIELKIK
ncbi:uncharacterized protein PHACADRAFT_264546 [Phanerochaete carnosa HHB-10118-sp]|uniref:BTB domain-containing protein n=1 Tax=Phanerochaete carnosa (strain HHB-10118-sp) TaxID=650164 RepID=K5UKB1_PHACS|nr:uncharacterized protein PHACADRAFT_264546 [Phanerochaete carnosa HHB-10118-sp]EKM50046.1 hypothetical protein PHACADRAFT_264546 [Phanerochaete carnosa HHB-10118-sp]